MKKIVIVSMDPRNYSSYGTITYNIITRLENKFDITVLALKHNPETPKTLPKGISLKLCENLSPEDTNDGYETFMKTYCLDLPDIVLLIDDSYNMGRYANCPERDNYELIMYAPIDGSPYPEYLAKILKMADKTVLYTEQSAKTIQSNTKYIIPAGVNSEVYHKDSTVIKNNAKLRLLFVGRNQFRKMNYNMLEIMLRLYHGAYPVCGNCGEVPPRSFIIQNDKELEKGVLDYKVQNWHCPYCGKKPIWTKGKPKHDISLHMHTPIFDEKHIEQHSGYRLKYLIQHYNLVNVTMTDHFYTLENGLTDDNMNKLYNCHDALLYLSGAEGFGMPCLEAMFTGLPSIYCNYSAHTHFCEKYGFPIEPSEYIPSKVTTYYRALTDQYQAINQILKIYNDPKLLANKVKLLEEDLPKLKNKYSWDTIAKQWEDIFNTNLLEKKSKVTIL